MLKVTALLLLERWGENRPQMRTGTIISGSRTDWAWLQP